MDKLAKWSVGKGVDDAVVNFRSLFRFRKGVGVVPKAVRALQHHIDKFFVRNILWNGCYPSERDALDV